MKWVLAVLLALVLAAGALRQMAIVGESAFCSTLGPDDTFLRWVFGCPADPGGAGGGGSGAK